MAAASLPIPGEQYGPCVDKTCGHKDCKDTRQLASKRCTKCKKSIGYGKRFFQDDNWKKLTHELCSYDDGPESLKELFKL